MQFSGFIGGAFNLNLWLLTDQVYSDFTLAMELIYTLLKHDYS